MLENNIQMALQQQTIELEDAIDLRDVRNIKLANQLLKIRRVKKQEKDRQAQLENIEAQSQANQQAAEASAQSEMQKNQAKATSDISIEEAKFGFETQKMMQEVQHKKELMQLEFEMNMRLKSVEVEGVKGREKEKEDRKDERTKIQASQQSELIDQRKNEKPPKNFESSGNDVLGGFNLGAFNPK